MENAINPETILIPTVLESSNNGSYFVIVPKSSSSNSSEEGSKLQTSTNNHPQHLMPKSHLVQYIDNTQQHQQLAQHSRQQRTPLNFIKDDKRRASHNEIERRRRDKISTWINQLGLLLPVPSHNKNESKCETLIKVCEYVADLKSEKKKLADKCSELKTIKESLKKLEEEVVVGLEENGYLKDELLKCGFQLEQVSAPESYLVYDAINNIHQKNTNNAEGGGDDDGENGTIHNDMDTYFQS